MKEKRGRKRRELRRTRASLGGERKELRKMKRTTKQSEETSQKKTQKQKKKNKASEVIETVQPERKKGKRQEEIYTKQKMASKSQVQNGKLRVNRHLVPPLHYNERQYQILLCKPHTRILLSSIDIRQMMGMNILMIVQSY